VEIGLVRRILFGYEGIRDRPERRGNGDYARFIREKHPDIRYINREEDMGLPGLRQAKESYKPDKMMVKYTARLVGELK